ILYREIAWSLYQKAISFAVDQIPTVPVVSALIGTAMDRYFTYRSMLVKSHNAMAYEMLNSAANGEPISGFDSLSEEDGVHAAVSMILAEAGVFSAWKWIFKKPSSKWRGTRKDENKQGEKSLNWLA